MTKATLLAALYGEASAKPDHFDRLNPGLRERVLPGEMIVLGDSQGISCTREEADLMQVAAQVNAKVRSLDGGEAQFIVDHYDLLETLTSTSSAGLGAGAVIISRQIDSIKATLNDLERLHQDSYGKYGHLNHPEFFEKRRNLFRKLDFSLGSLARKGMSLDEDVKLKRALGLSSKSIVHHWNKAGLGGIPGYGSNYDKLASGARYAKRALFMDNDSLVAIVEIVLVSSLSGGAILLALILTLFFHKVAEIEGKIATPGKQLDGIRQVWGNGPIGRWMVSNGMDSSSPNRHLRAKMVSEQSTIEKMRRSPDEYYPRRC